MIYYYNLDSKNNHKNLAILDICFETYFDFNNLTNYLFSHFLQNVNSSYLNITQIICMTLKNNFSSFSANLTLTTLIEDFYIKFSKKCLIN